MKIIQKKKEKKEHKKSSYGRVFGEYDFHGNDCQGERETGEGEG